MYLAEEENIEAGADNWYWKQYFYDNRVRIIQAKVVPILENVHLKLSEYSFSPQTRCRLLMIIILIITLKRL